MSDFAFLMREIIFLHIYTVCNSNIIYEVGSWTYTGVVFDGMVVLCCIDDQHGGGEKQME